MGRKINVMARWKEFNPKTERSMMDDFEEKQSPYIGKILDYLSKGKVTRVSSSVAIDVFTGAVIEQESYIMTDGEYSWSSSLGYYIRKYYLRIPQDFERKILNG